MKGNIKTLMVLVIIVAVAMFTALAMASGDDHKDPKGKKTMNAKYAFAGSGNCLIAINGFNPSLQPNDGVWFWGPVTLDEGVITFNKDGTGSVKNILHAYDIWSPDFPPTQPPPDAAAADETFDFTYTMTNSGNITITYTEGSYELDFTSGPSVSPSPMAVQYFILPPVKGVVSPDGKILYVSWGAPYKYINTLDKDNKDPTGVEAICSVVIQGFWIGP
jgi:hypothetical protein